MVSAEPPAGESTNQRSNADFDQIKTVNAESDNKRTDTSGRGTDDPKPYERVIANWTVVVGIFTCLLFIATGVSAYFLWRTDVTLQETLTATSRAWIVPQDVVIEQREIGKPIKVGIVYENVGKEPATDIIETNQIILDNIDAVNAFLRSVPEKWKACMAEATIPGANVAYPVSPTIHSYQFHISTALLPDDAFNSGDKAFVLYGCFAYRTGGNTHHTSFCRTFRSTAVSDNSTVGCFTGENAD